MDAHAKNKRSTTDLASWLVAGWLAMVYLCTGLTKLFGLWGHVQAFEAWHFPSWFVYGVGAAETFFAVLLIVPGLTSIGAFALGLIMLGALATHLMFAQYWIALLPLAMLAALVFVCVCRLGDLLALGSEEAHSH